MSLELLLSTMNLKVADLDNMNIHTPCIVINQCGKVGYKEYKNFRIYDTDDIGISRSRNMAIAKSKADILLFCDNDCVYNDDYYETILNFYKEHEDADMVFFNMSIYDNSIKPDTKVKRVFWYNYQRYAAYRISFRRESVFSKNINLCSLFGGNSMYSHGEDTIFIRDFLKDNMRLYASSDYIGKVIDNDYESTWFRGYDDKFFFDKGALFCALSPHFKYLQCTLYVLRHKEVRVGRSFTSVLFIMFKGVRAYGKNIGYSANI